jgi:DNA polymerase I-like protein with 3'-5' exonuclease and polymerase domains
MNLLFLGTEEDKAYLPRLKPLVGVGHVTSISLTLATTLAEILFICKKKEITGVICTQAALIYKFTGELQIGKKKLPSLDAYSGSLFTKDGVDFVFINPLKHLVSVPYGSLLTGRYISKLTKPNKWLHATPFTWEIATAATLDHLYAKFSSAFAIAVDIETFQENLAIRCVGYCAVWLQEGKFTSHSIVIPCDSEFNLSWIRKFNQIPVRKVFQNGKYDVAYLSRYNAVPTHWYWDTAHLMHSWYSELPKDLGFLASFFIRKARYWKHESTSTNIEDYYLYNARDTWNTANVLLAWIHEAPKWAQDNYLMEFPMVYPCHLSEMTGLKMHLPTLLAVRAKEEATVENEVGSLNKMLGLSNFNTNSPVQVKALLKVLGQGDMDSTDEKSLTKAAHAHPLNAHILNKIIAVRKARKQISTYLDETKALEGRILYSLNPHGTDTGRLASKEHHFWCGLQIQNIPRIGGVKSFLVADEGFFLGEADYEQAESRGTAYITGDKNLLTAVNSDRDFHATNASAFFGVPYEKIVDLVTKKVLDKALRDLAKRVNHGATYNMGAGVLIDTMGDAKIIEAKHLLKLPRLWSHFQVATYLLAMFAKAYPIVKGDYQAHVITQVDLHQKLVGATGWTRYCFGHPKTNKPDLNTYVAHCPQSLNAMILNKAYLKVFNKVWIPHNKNFKLCAQIHDSILFQYREGHEYLIDLVKECMEIPIPVTDISEVTRTLLVPVAISSGGKSWADSKG